MVYMGSKNKYCDELIPILQEYIDNNNITTYIEPFVGGANVIDKIKCENKKGYDRSETLIALLNQMKTDFSKLPLDGNREMWDEGKAYVKDGVPLKTMNLADVGAIEFFASFSNGGFPRGYAKNKDGRNYYNEAYRNAEKQVPNLKDINFECLNYKELPAFTNSLIYCDPPYRGTKQYGYAKDNWSEKDFDDFWDWVREQSKSNVVLISEQSAPSDFKCIWEQKVKRTAGKDNNYKVVEKLFILDKDFGFDNN